MSIGSIRVSRMGQGEKDSWKSALKLEAQHGGKKERTWSSKMLNFREERWQSEKRH